MNNTSRNIVFVLFGCVAVYSATAGRNDSVAGATSVRNGEETLAAAEFRDAPRHLAGIEGLVGDRSAGRQLFFSPQLMCASCHSTEPGEESWAPNLAGVGSRLSRDQLIAAVLEPSADYAAGYKPVQLRLAGHDDDEPPLFAVELATNEASVRVRLDDGAVVEFQRSEIIEYVVGPSWMPTKLAERLTRQEFADLVAFLGSLQLEDEDRAKGDSASPTHAS